MQDFFTYWGKAQPAHEQRCRAHPLIWHSLDVAACAQIWLENRPHIAVSLAQATKASEAEARALLVVFASLHDIGKFSIGFQAKVPDLFPRSLFLPQNVPHGDHTALGYRLMTEELAEFWGKFAPNIDEGVRNILAGAIAGHHGRPVSASGASAAEIGLAAIEAARSCTQTILEVLGNPEFDGSFDEKSARIFSWRLAGFINLADWLGSNQHFFPYAAPMEPASYWKNHALPAARRALSAAGLQQTRLAEKAGYYELCGNKFAPSPLQNHAETTVFANNEPVFALIEDLTGSGKTEAALIMAHRLMRNGLGNGIFIALPTMATANALYGRMCSLYRKLYAPGEIPSLALSHGASRLNEGFQDSILLHWGEPSQRNDSHYGSSADDSDITASAACAAWLGTDRRRSCFAEIGVGTIDQAFLSVLPVKFAALRQFGLSSKILILDEIHAYGAYESEEIARLITFHAAQGGSLIALSATLPDVVKARLLKAWRLGRGGQTAALARKTVEWPTAYPLCTTIDSGGITNFSPLKPRADLPRKVKIERIADPQAAVDAIFDAAGRGACVAWIRNTVDDVLAAYDMLEARGIKVLIFHARFAMCDRQSIEKQTLETFGPASNPQQRKGKVIVASQVLEQSLDLDFDLLVSDLAPVDLIIQRAGRLWRHGRGVKRPLLERRLLLVTPLPEPNADKTWLKTALRGTSFVYKNHALMWRSAQVLLEAGEIDSPDGIRPLIEGVYGPGRLDDAPQGLQRQRAEAEGSQAGDRAIAQLNLLDLKSGYSFETKWTAEVFTPTRLGEERTILRLARWDGKQLQPWSGNDSSDTRESERLWSLSEVAVAVRRGENRGTYPENIADAANRLEKIWREKGQQAVILPLLAGDNGKFDYGLLKRATGEEVKIAYLNKRGLTFLS